MHPSFTFNFNARSCRQQPSGGPIYNLGSSPMMSHQPGFFVNHQFNRSFASVVSCDADLRKIPSVNNTNPGIFASFIQHFTPNHHQNQFQPPTTTTPISSNHQHKEFEDFHHMPHHYNNQQQYPMHFYHPAPTDHINNMKIPLIQTTFYQSPPPPPQPQPSNVHPSAKSQMQQRSFISKMFHGCQPPQHQQQQNNRDNRWFKRGFRCRNNYKPQKFQDNGRKNLHEKERSIIEHDIKDDCCDFVHVIEDVALTNVQKVNSEVQKETHNDDPPFMIYSLDDFPAIETTVEQKKPAPAKESSSSTKGKTQEGFVCLPAQAVISTPSCVPPRMSLCDKILKSPQKLLQIPITLKPCLKAPRPRRTISECSDDFIVFAHGTDDESSNCGEEEDEDYDDDKTDTDSDSSDDDEVDGGSSEEEDDEEDEVQSVITPEHQVDSGLEDKRVRFSSTPKVHVMRVWDFAYRKYRKGDYWQQFARDHERFRKRIQEQSVALSKVLDPKHRQKIYSERFQTPQIDLD